MYSLTAKNKEIKEINLTKLSTINQLDLSGGFTCDLETGICGPAEKIQEENVEEKKNANNNMV